VFDYEKNMSPTRKTAAARRKLLPVEMMPLVGGRACLDLANTTGARSSSDPRERLETYRDVLVWSRRAGLLGKAEAQALAARSASRGKEAGAALKRVREVREILYRLLRSAAERRAPSPSDVEQFNRLWRKDRSRREIVAAGHALEVQLPTAPHELDRMIWPAVESAVDLLTSGAVARLKRCGECDWLFLDDTKNQSRTWCKKECGDRVRARRYYGRIRKPGHASRGKERR
jgi:predicted RNA-binding Zn ribbon-like protein